MAGVVLETLSWKKLIFVAVALFLGQAICFLIGGLITPTPNGYSQILAEKCVDRLHGSNPDKWFYTRSLHDSDKITCDDVIPDDYLDSDHFLNKYSADQIVFVTQFPLPRDGMSLNMSRWFQHVLAVLTTDIKYTTAFEMDKETIITLDIRLGYRNKEDKEWSLLSQSREERPLKCKIDEEHQKLAETQQISGYYYDCELVPLFSLPSCYYDEYLVNIRFPSSNGTNGLNRGLGQLKDVWLTEFHQNGGFTMIWFGLKSVLFLITLSALIFFWRRINILTRRTNLLEQTIISLGIFMTILNFPIEWLSLKYNLSFWLVLSDVRQGAFYAMLLCFWVIFCGEHQLDDCASHQIHKSPTQRLYHLYSYQLIPVAVSSCLLFLFELAERGVQLTNPFYSVWSQKSSAKLAVAFVVLAAICAPLYLIFLVFKIFHVIKQILSKRAIIPSLPEIRQRFYRGIIYRFIIFIVYTLICAILTVLFFVISQIDESQWKWGEKHMEYTSAFITGVYGMWNFYVTSILCLYAPSHKYRNSENQSSDIKNLLPTTSGAALSTNSDDLIVKYQTGSGDRVKRNLQPDDDADVDADEVNQEVTFDKRTNSGNTQPLNSSKIVNPLESLVFLNKSNRN